MKKLHLAISFDLIRDCVLAVALALATTAIFLLIGRSTLGEAVIALVYLVPIGWSTTRWGQLPGICAALTAALCFDFFFIPPFLTLDVGSLEGWLLLAIFVMVAVVIIGRIEYGLDQAHAHERDAVMMYELNMALFNLHTPDEIARELAERLRVVFQASYVQVSLRSEADWPAIVASAPAQGTAQGRPDRILPLLSARGLMGEICLWRGEPPLPLADDRLLQIFVTQGAQAIQRVRSAR